MNRQKVVILQVLDGPFSHDKKYDYKPIIVNNVNKYLLERCINIIINSNQDVNFNKIFYSKENEAVYFYADKNLNLNAWNDSESIIYSKKRENITTLEEVKSVLMTKENYDCSVISVYDILKFLDGIKKESNKLIEDFNNIREFAREENFEGITFNFFNYNKKELHITLRRKYHNENIYMVLAEEKGNIYLKEKSCSAWDTEINNTIYKFGHFFEKFFKNISHDKYKNFFTSNTKERIESINSNFLLSFDSKKIVVSSESNSFSQSDKLEFGYDFESEKYGSDGSITISNILKNNEDLFLKRILINIEDCPEWTKSHLYEIRRKEIGVLKVKNLIPKVAKKILLPSKKKKITKV